MVPQCPDEGFRLPPDGYYGPIMIIDEERKDEEPVIPGIEDATQGNLARKCSCFSKDQSSLRLEIISEGTRTSGWQYLF